VRRGLVVAAALLLAIGAGAGSDAEGAAEEAGAPPGASPLTLRWLGVAGFTLGDGESALAFDPFFSRPGLWDTLIGDYTPDAEVLAPLLAPGSPAPELARAGHILVGHSHYDHLGDAPWVATRTGATLVGSLTSVNLARGYGLPAGQARRADPGDVLDLGSFRVRVVESRHAPVLFGRVPLRGEVTEPATGPVHATSFLLGDARGYWVTHAPSGVRVFVLSSAAVHPPAFEGLLAAGERADVVLAPTQGREPGYAAALVRALRPRLVVPHHFDDFFEPLSSPEAALPGDPDDLEAFEAEVREAAAAEGLVLEVRRPALFGEMAVPAS